MSTLTLAATPLPPATPNAELEAQPWQMDLAIAKVAASDKVQDFYVARTQAVLAGTGRAQVAQVGLGRPLFHGAHIRSLSPFPSPAKPTPLPEHEGDLPLPHFNTAAPVPAPINVLHPLPLPHQVKSGFSTDRQHKPTPTSVTTSPRAAAFRKKMAEKAKARQRGVSSGQGSSVASIVPAPPVAARDVPAEPASNSASVPGNTINAGLPALPQARVVHRLGRPSIHAEPMNPEVYAQPPAYTKTAGPSPSGLALVLVPVPASASPFISVPASSPTTSPEHSADAASPPLASRSPSGSAMASIPSSGSIPSGTPSPTDTDSWGFQLVNPRIPEEKELTLEQVQAFALALLREKTGSDFTLPSYDTRVWWTAKNEQGEVEKPVMPPAPRKGRRVGVV